MLRVEIKKDMDVNELRDSVNMFLTQLESMGVLSSQVDIKFETVVLRTGVEYVSYITYEN